MSSNKENANPLQRLEALGQSVWLDYIRRDLIDSGGLARLVREDWLRGVTSNPSIFEKAVSGSRDYAELIAGAARQGMSAKAIYEQLAIRDIRDTAEVLDEGVKLFADAFDKLLAAVAREAGAAKA